MLKPDNASLQGGALDRRRVVGAISVAAITLGGGVTLNVSALRSISNFASVDAVSAVKQAAREGALTPELRNGQTLVADGWAGNTNWTNSSSNTCSNKC